jgi:hypothetical protein
LRPKRQNGKQKPNVSVLQKSGLPKLLGLQRKSVCAGRRRRQKQKSGRRRRYGDEVGEEDGARRVQGEQEVRVRLGVIFLTGGYTRGDQLHRCRSPRPDWREYGEDLE